MWNLLEKARAAAVLCFAIATKKTFIFLSFISLNFLALQHHEAYSTKKYSVFKIIIAMVTLK